MTGSKTHETKTWQIPLNEMKIRSIQAYMHTIKVSNFFRVGFFPIFLVFLPLHVYVLTSEMAGVKFSHGVLVKCSQYRDTGAPDPSYLKVNSS